ncbi:MAG: hypothetical protein IJE05_06750 [Clostridia bacterium]|nr:hypothetical protein [Clostridia bacterium]
MSVVNSVETVWLIEDNELKKANKLVSKLNYKGMELAVLKTELDNYNQDVLIKDQNNEYWKMNIIRISFDNFAKAINDNTDISNTRYCNEVMRYFSQKSIEGYFAKKIANTEYFNMCELKYISKYHPELYKQAAKCRDLIRERNRQYSAKREEELRQQIQKKVEEVNDKFESSLTNIKTKIRIGGRVEAQDLEFYKDNDYYKGKTTQNCFLYLAKQYGIQIPIATQGFINNRLVSYDFTTGSYSYKITNNKKPSTKIHEYLEMIQVKVKEEFDNSVKEMKRKIESLKGER